MDDKTTGAAHRMIERRNRQRYAAEGLGTFAIVFAGCGAIISNTQSEVVTHPGICLTFGLVVAMMIFALGPISAAHFNPAVTLGFVVAQRFPWQHVMPYIGAQLGGALVASGLHALLYGVVARRAHFGATVPSVPLAAAVGFEVVLTFVLMLVIMAVATDKRVPGTVPGLAIGGTVALDALFGGPMTGASMNLARSFAPALLDWALAGGTSLSSLPIYLLAPCVGAVVAALCFEGLRDGAAHAQGAPADYDTNAQKTNTPNADTAKVDTLDDALRLEPGLSRQQN